MGVTTEQYRLVCYFDICRFVICGVLVTVTTLTMNLVFILIIVLLTLLSGDIESNPGPVKCKTISLCNVYIAINYW